MANSTNLTLDAVKVGDQLPRLPVDVTASTVILGALATRDWRPMHHDKDFAVNRNGVKDIFMNTPNLAAWFERYITDWTGPKGRLGRMKFRMRGSIFPEETMVFSGSVTGTGTDDVGCGWAELNVEVKVDDKVCTSCEVRVALPTHADDNPWQRRGDDWRSAAE
jgi:hydroxyacyl-ACP dehydratase HTD2-like protein with hotdog domain